MELIASVYGTKLEYPFSLLELYDLAEEVEKDYGGEDE